MIPIEASPGRPAAPVSVGARLDRMPITATHRRLTVIVGIGLFFDTFENNLSGTISKVLQNDFALDGTALKWVLASAFIGQFIGSLVLGKVADRYGRRRAFLINLAIYSGFSLLGALSPNVGWLIATRFLAGIGIGAEQTLSDTYLADVLPASRRGRFIAWAYTLAYCGVPAVGFMALWLVPLSPLGVAGWRWLFVAGSLGSAVVWLLRRQLVESPRWLASQGRDDEAEHVLATFRAPSAVRDADAPDAPVRAETPGAATPPVAAGAGVRAAFAPGLRRRTVLLWVFCLLSVVGYYGFGTLAPQVLAAKGFGVVQGISFTALSFLGYPLGSLLSLPIIDRVQRKVLAAASAGLMTAFGLGFGLATSSVMIVLCGVGFTLVANVFANASHVFLSEQYPTRIRAAASGAAYSMSKLGSAGLPFVLLPVLDAFGPVAFFAVIGAAMTVLAAMVLGFGERTTGTSVDAVEQGAIT